MDTINIMFDIPLLNFITGALMLYLLYRYSTRNHSYWKEKGVPHIKPYPIIGSFLGFAGKKFEEAEVENCKKYGSIYGYYEFNKPNIIIADPELIRNIFVKDFQYFPIRRSFHSGDELTEKMVSMAQGDDWKRIRSIISPTFSTGKIKRVMSIFQECAKTVVQNFKDISGNDSPIDVLGVYGAFGVDVIACSAFSTKIESHNDPENNFVKYSKLALNQGLNLKILFILLMPRIMSKLKVSIFNAKSMEFFKNATLEIIEERRKTGETRNDFLQLLLDAAAEGAKEENWEQKSDYIAKNHEDDSTNHAVFMNKTSKRLSMDELVAQCCSFFFGGYHTTAVTLGISSYLLALNPDAQDKLFKELKDVLTETDGKLTYEAIQNMKYLDSCITETLRLYPPVQRLERTALADYKLGDTGITIPKGMIIGVPVYALQRNSKFYPEPDKFNPDRFNQKEIPKLVPYSYLPFGAGPRNCVAMRFALVELKVCLIYVFSTFHVQRCSETKVPLDIGKGGLIQPEPIKLCFTVRKECPLKA